MTRMTVSASVLRSAVSVHLPILKRAGFGPIDRLLVVVGEGSVHFVSSDRFVAAAYDLRPKEIEDPRRIRITLERPQLLLLRAYLTHVAPPLVPLRITDVALTLDYDGRNPLTLLAGEAAHYTDILKVTRPAFEEEALEKVATQPKAYNPGLISHIDGVELWSSGDDGRPSIFRSKDHRTFGIIMPLRCEVAPAIRELRDENPALFDETYFDVEEEETDADPTTP